MRKLIVLVCLLLMAVVSHAQVNHVPNGSFEQYNVCPNNTAQIANALGWSTFNLGTPDYFNICCTNNIAGVPNNTMGSQMPAHGNGYAGIAPGGSSVGELLACSITPLIVGKRYQVSMSVSLADNVTAPFNGELSVLFIKNGPFFINSFGVAPYVFSPQIVYNNYGALSDKTNWQRYSKDFVADSPYAFIAIGNLTPNNPNLGAYVYLDSVVVQEGPTIQVASVSSNMLCRGDVIQVAFNANNIPGYFQPGNIFTLQLSDAAGSFVNTTNIGTLAGIASGIVTGTIPMALPTSNNYRVRVKSSNSVDSSEGSSPISIGNIIPAKPVATTNTPLCTGTGDLSLNATTTTPGVTWNWSGPQSFTSTQQNPSIPSPTTSASGNYIVEASIYGCKSEKDTVAVSVFQTPPATIAAGNTPLCTGQNISLTSTLTSTGLSFSWTGPGGYTANVQNPIRTLATTAMSGDYIVTATENGCSVKDTVTIEVRPTPTVTASSNFNICEGMPINMLASSNEPAATFSWTGPLGFTANTAITVRSNSTVPMSGNYVVTAELNGCSSQYTLPVVINPQPILPTVTSNSIACDTLKLFATGSAGATYYWNGPGGYTSNQQNPFIQPASPAHNGIYTVFSTLGPCVSAGVSTQASVHPKPYLGAYASPNDTVCDGTVVTFVTVPMNGIQNPVFQWFKNGAAVPGQTSLTYVGAYTTGDKFYCSTYAQDLCNNNITLYSNEISMVVVPIVNSLSASISSTPAIPQPGQPINFKCDVVSGGYTPQFQWRKNGQDILGAIHANWSANNLMPYDEITCHVTSSDPCAAPKETVAAKVVVNFPTSAGSMQADNEIAIYPNPNSGNFTIESKTYKVTEVEVLNSIGQKVYSLKASGKTLNISLPASLANGIYTLKLNTEAGIHQQRITLQR